MIEVTAKEMIALIDKDIEFALRRGDKEFVGYLKEEKAKILENYAEEFGGIDKDDFMVVAALLKRGMENEAFKYTMKLDTDPKEYLLVTMGWVEKVNMEYAELFGEK